LVLAVDSLEIGGDGALSLIARNTRRGEEAAFAVRVRGGLQPSRLGGAVNPLAHVEADAVTLRSVGEPTERFVQAAAEAWEQPGLPPPRPRWRRLFERAPAERARPEVRFAALLVTRDGDVSSPRLLHLKLFCDGGEMYLDIDVAARRVALVEKDPEFRPALLRALFGLV
jgi:hypothetical protein